MVSRIVSIRFLGHNSLQLAAREGQFLQWRFDVANQAGAAQPQAAL
jgi:hypothetical protein